jgi:hypothetical protein
MKFIDNLPGDAIAWGTDSLVHTLPMWAWEHKLWLIAMIPVVGVIVLAKYLWD